MIKEEKVIRNSLKNCKTWEDKILMVADPNCEMSSIEKKILFELIELKKEKENIQEVKN